MNLVVSIQTAGYPHHSIILHFLDTHTQWLSHGFTTNRGNVDTANTLNNPGPAQHGMSYVNRFNTLRPGQNGRRFADDTFKRIFLNENVRIAIKISLKFVPKGPINNNPALVQITAWRRSGDKPLSEPMMVRLLTHICVTRPQWVNTLITKQYSCHLRRWHFHMHFLYWKLLSLIWNFTGIWSCWCN